MSKDALFNLPEITDEDIHWAERLLGLPENAFYGKDGNDPRVDVLKSTDAMDIIACPGSGKTTILVAKLAILANKWEHRTRGICVLSHTNAARREIEKRLGCTAVGRQLLSYPHYIGTIHAFVDGFLSLPWLRSLGYPIKIIDTEICLKRRWNALPVNTRIGLEKNRHNRSVLTIKTAEFDMGEVRWGRGYTLRKDSVTYREMREICTQSTCEGFFCYDEMFVWAANCLDNVPNLVHTIRERFPVLFIDETQDNSEDQSRLLNRVFVEGQDRILRQRFGDSNQAIYHSVDDEGATTDAFPSNDVKKSVPNSYRFGSTIATLAEPLSLVAYADKLSGNGPRPICCGSCIGEGPHTIFLFQDDTIGKVLPAYGELIIEIFPEAELERGIFTAVGQVHKDKKDDYRPRHVGHYWPGYDSELTKIDAPPEKFIHYIRAGQEQAEASGEINFGVEKVAEGILRLAGMAKNGPVLRPRRRSHRYVLELLEKEKELCNLYRLIVNQIVIKRVLLTKHNWQERWAKCIRIIGENIARDSLSNAEADAFLEWRATNDPGAQENVNVRHDNIYRYPEDDPKVLIKVGSIHSVKGQNHTATLVMETFWYKHNLENLKKRLIGEKIADTSLGTQGNCRLKIHYVAMTRPTHLLCLAMKRNTFEDNNGNICEDQISALQEHGWNIRYV